MFALTTHLMRSYITRHNCLSNVSTKRLLSQIKFLKDQQLRRDAKLQSIQEVVLQKKSETNGNINWQQLVTQLTQQRLVFKHNYEFDLMAAFLLNNGNDCHKVDHKLFKSLVNYIKLSPNITNNCIAASRYCHFISHFSDFIDSTDAQLIRQTTDVIINKYEDNKVADQVAIDCVIGLAKSSKDNCVHAMKLLNQLKSNDKNLIISLIDSSIKHKLFDHTFDLTKKYPDFKFDDKMIGKLVEYINNSNIGFDQTLDIFRNFSFNLVVFETHLKDIIIEIMKRFEFKEMNTIVDRKGLCSSCGQTLDKLSTEDHQNLIYLFKDKIFNKQNDLMMASFSEYEKELENFHKFIKKQTTNRPLDLVIDGLNIAFATHADIVEDKSQLRKYVYRYDREVIDRNAVEMLLRNNIFDKFDNILMIGRRHMKNWKLLTNLIWDHRKQMTMFYTMDKTRDDCYTLYAGLQNPNTYILSGDFYRDYLTKLEIKPYLFKRWLRTHQIFIQNKKIMIYPDQFEYKINISKDNKTLHIPFNNSDNTLINWLCFQKQ
ncbi:mitochondrial ribonuclease P catalytic subunit-like [Oppia nitens]|uniref:mitochondrial ribonuclease P catalytic subunit-like n=1 Tax=Oppia nitens TaxID=1686743 RepID=UPI0023DA47F4|nr:mitochondrial ribonuclease P catalytic subunit-like [Oppia nitens]